MNKNDLKLLRLSLWWGMGICVVVALIQAQGSISKSAIITLCIIGGSATSLAMYEHGWFRAPEKIGTPVRSLLLIGLCAAIFAGLGRFVWPKSVTHAPDDITQINDKDFIDAIAGWGVDPAPAGTTGGGGVGYEEINTARFLPFQAKYDLLMIARIHDTRLSAFYDRDILKSNVFPIPSSALAPMRITIPIDSKFLGKKALSGSGDSGMEFHLCLIPHGLDIATVTSLSDVPVKGGHVFSPSHAGGMTVQGAPLAPYSPKAHVAINEYAAIAQVMWPEKKVKVVIEFTADTLAQTHTDTRMHFDCGGTKFNTNNVPYDFVTRDQAQAVGIELHFSDKDWNACIAGGTPLLLRVPVEYQDQGVKMVYTVTGRLNAKSDEVSDLKVERHRK